MLICKQIIIHSHISRVYTHYYDLGFWPQILDDILNVEINFQDENYQKFSMVVSRPSGVETISGYRFCVSDEKIELYQNVPPPGFKSMRGAWLFSAPTGNITKVEAIRDVEPIDENQREAIGNKINFYLEKNLSSFKEYIENGLY